MFSEAKTGPAISATYKQAVKATVVNRRKIGRIKIAPLLFVVFILKENGRKHNASMYSLREFWHEEAPFCDVVENCM